MTCQKFQKYRQQKLSPQSFEWDQISVSVQNGHLQNCVLSASALLNQAHILFNLYERSSTEINTIYF